MQCTYATTKVLFLKHGGQMFSLRRVCEWWEMLVGMRHRIEHEMWVGGQIDVTVMIDIQPQGPQYDQLLQRVR